LAADRVSSLLAGCLTSFPDTIFAQNVSLIRMTAITSRRVVAVAGFFLVGLSLIPKMGEVVVSLPGPVIGSVSLVMFATVAVVGITTIEKVDFAGDNLHPCLAGHGAAGVRDVRFERPHSLVTSRNELC
jgi:xanthine/uracil permease